MKAKMSPDTWILIIQIIAPIIIQWLKDKNREEARERIAEAILPHVGVDRVLAITDSIFEKIENSN